MQRRSADALWPILVSDAQLSSRHLWGAAASVNLSGLAQGSCLAEHFDELRGRSVLLAVRDQLAAALALIELDGIASRIVLCPPDVSAAHLPVVAAAADANAVVWDGTFEGVTALGIKITVIASSQLAPSLPRRG